MRILILNGPNLNLTGSREPSIYGAETFESYLAQLRSEFGNLKIDYFQTNIEGEIIDRLQKVNSLYEGVIMNAGGYTHTSIAIADALNAVTIPVVEVHISNILAREKYRHVSLTAPFTSGVISGFGLKGYRLALLSLIR